MKIKLFEDFITELSSDTILSAARKMDDLKQNNRSNKLLKNSVFSEFIDSELCLGKIKDISKKSEKSIFKSDTDYLNIVIDYNRKWMNNSKDYTIKYDINKDKLIIPKAYGVEVTRKDARILSKIVSVINPNSQYKNGVGDITITHY
jgi:hypothetical protein